jgi:Fe-Mn family superoxide dismutase
VPFGRATIHNMAIELPPLPYALDALAPHINVQTLTIHHGKHHQAYVTNGNKLIEGTEFANKPLVDIIKATAGKADKAGIFNNAAQVWNHTFYWHSMKPKGGGAPTGAIAAKLNDLGGYAKFVELFSQAGATQFGSGWAWLVLKNGRLEVTKSPNAETPLTQPGVTPLLTMDVWEHAYYLDFQNRRPDYIKTFLDHLVNWDFANANLQKA